MDVPDAVELQTRDIARTHEKEREKGKAILNGYASSAVLSDNASGR